MRGAGQPALRSVNSESESHAIERRKTFRGSLCPSMTKGHAAALYGSGVSGPAGVGLEHVQTDKRGSPGTWEILSFPQRNPGRRHRVTNSRLRRCTRPPRSAQNECIRGTAKRRQRSAAGRAAGSRSALILPWKQGNSPWRTLWREAKRRSADLSEGNMSNPSRFDQHVTVTRLDSHRDPRGRRTCRPRNRMR